MLTSTAAINQIFASSYIAAHPVQTMNAPRASSIDNVEFILNNMIAAIIPTVVMIPKNLLILSLLSWNSQEVICIYKFPKSPLLWLSVPDIQSISAYTYDHCKFIYLHICCLSVMFQYLFDCPHNTHLFTHVL